MQSESTQEQKCAVIVGGTSGIGLALAEGFLENGYTVEACGVGQLPPDRAGLTFHQVDVANREAVDAFMSAMIRDVLGSQEDAREALLGLSRAFADSIETHPDHAKVWLDWSTAVRDETWPMWLDFQRRTLRRIRAKIRTGIAAGSVPPDIDVDAAARMFNGASHIVALMKFGAAKRSDVDRMLVHLVDSALRMPLAGN